MANKGIWHKFMQFTRYSCLYLALSLISTNSNPQYYDTITLTLEGQDLPQYRYILNKSQIKKSAYLTEKIVEFDQDTGKIVFDPDVTFSERVVAKEGELIYSLPLDADKGYLTTGFSDGCSYLQNVDFDQDNQELPMPLFLENSHNFYNLKQLTNQEVLFIKEIESFDNNFNYDNPNPFDIDMTRMNNLFKIADFLQIKRLFTIIAGRHASLMTNMNKQQMIKWLLDIKYRTPKPIVSNSNNDQYNNNNGKTKMIPLLQQTQSFSNEECGNNANELDEYNFKLLDTILSFLSCYDIRTFASISDVFYRVAGETKAIRLNIDPMIEILTNNNDATCLSLTNQELLFYKSFLSLPQSKWTQNQKNVYDKLYDKLQTMANNIINVDSENNQFHFETLISFRDEYSIHTLGCEINGDDTSIEISSRIEFQKYFGSVSFKFGKFAQQLNDFAEIRNIHRIKINICYFEYLSSFNDLIGINDINNIKSIFIFEHSFQFINFEEIYNINSQIEYLHIQTTNKDKVKTVSIKNIQFLSKMGSLKKLRLSNNKLDSFDFNVLTELASLEIIMVHGNKFDYKLDTQCLDFRFLHNLPNLRELHLDNNQIECTDNFITIQKSSNLVVLDLRGNRISSLDLKAFQGTNLAHINLGRNQLSSLSLDSTSQSQPCLDFNSFTDIRQLKALHLEFNQIQCIVNFESIQQLTQLNHLDLSNNHLLSSIDLTKFDESKPIMNSLTWIFFENMNLVYTMQNDNCLDLQFLKFMPNVEELDFSNNKIECIDNASILQRQDVKLEYLYLNDNILLSFDFGALIGSNIGKIHLTNNNLSPESLQNFDANTLSRINPSAQVLIDIMDGNEITLPRGTPSRVVIV